MRGSRLLCKAMRRKAAREASMILRTVTSALLATLPIACATTPAPRPLTVSALERAKITCRAPDAELHLDQHLSIVLPGYDPDHQRQIDCLFEQLRGYAFDQIVSGRAPASGL